MTEDIGSILVFAFIFILLIVADYLLIKQCMKSRGFLNCAMFIIVSGILLIFITAGLQYLIVDLWGPANFSS